MSHLTQCANLITPSKGFTKRNGSLAMTTNRQSMLIIAAAMRDPQFAAQWNECSDVSFRPFAIAVLQLSNATQMSEKSRRAIYQDLCLRKRTAVLADAVGKPVKARMVKFLSRTRWNEFSRDDWHLFFSLIADEGSSALGHVLQITPTLVRQFELIPEEIRLPSLLGVVSNLSVPAERWAKLDGFIKDASGERRVEFRRAAASINSNGDFWDFYFQCEGKHLLPFVTPQSFMDSPLLEPIGSSKDMMSEAIRMKNCLASRTSSVQSGHRFFFRLRDGTPVNSELVRRGPTWVPGEILGYQNSPVNPEIANAIDVELQQLALSIPKNWGADGSDDKADHFAKLRQFARESFTAEDFEMLTTPLHSIHAKSESWSDGAYTIFQHKHGGYVQFMSSPDGSEYLIELSSHKYQDHINKFLSSDTVSLIEDAGFVWPTSKSNFLRWFNVSSPDDFQSMAEVALAILARVFGHRKGGGIMVTVELPY